MSPPNSAANLNRFLLPFNPMAPIYVKTQRDIDKNTNTSHHIKPTIQKLPQPTSGNRSKPSSLHLKPVRPLSSPTPCLRSAATRSAKPWGGGGLPPKNLTNLKQQVTPTGTKSYPTSRRLWKSHLYQNNPKPPRVSIRPTNLASSTAKYYKSRAYSLLQRPVIGYASKTP